MATEYSGIDDKTRFSRCYIELLRKTSPKHRLSQATLLSSERSGLAGTD